MEWNDLREEVGYFEGSYDNPADLSPATWTLMRFTEWEDPKGNLEWLIRKDGCMHCADPGCLEACPSPGAIVQYANGIVDFVSENCIGCGYCIKGCPFNIPRLSQADQKVYKCTLCSDRVAVGQSPACAKACPTGAIVFGTKSDMTAWAGERIDDLKSRGFDQAGLYDPPGVGGTHVMYVLHHADTPSIYAGLPDNPHISRLVQAWKGVDEADRHGGSRVHRGGRLHALDGGRPERGAAGGRSRTAATCWMRGRNETAARDTRALHHRGAPQPLDHRRLPDPARAVGHGAVPSVAVLPDQPVRRRRLYAGDPSLVRQPCC